MECTAPTAPPEIARRLKSQPAHPPQAHGVGIHLEAASNLGIVVDFGCRRHDPSTHRDPLGRPMGPHQAFQS